MSIELVAFSSSALISSGVKTHVLVLGELVALDDVVLRDHVVFLGADVLLLQARAALLVQHVELNVAEDSLAE